MLKLLLVSVSKKEVRQNETFPVLAYWSMGCISDLSGVFFLPQNHQTLPLRAVCRQLIALVLQTEVSLCQSCFIFSFCEAVPFIIFDTHS